MRKKKSIVDFAGVLDKTEAEKILKELEEERKIKGIKPLGKTQDPMN